MKMSLERVKMLDEARQGRKPFWIVELLIFAVVFVVGALLQNLVMAVPQSSEFLNSAEYQTILKQYSDGIIDTETMSQQVQELSVNMAQHPSNSIVVIMLFSTAAAMAAVLIYCKFIEKRPLSSLGFRRKNALLEYLAGAGIGAGLFSVAVLINVLFGGLRFEGLASNISWGYIGLFFVGFLIQGMEEEVVCRGYLMVSLAKRLPVVVAVGISSVIFAALHLANNGVSVLAVVNLTLFGLFAAVYFLKRGNIWGACAIHSMWNFFQGNFYGISVSGMEEMDTIFKFSSVDAREIINGGSFGLEGGIGVTIVLTVGLIVLLFTKTKECELSEVSDELSAVAV